MNKSSSVLYLKLKFILFLIISFCGVFNKSSIAESPLRHEKQLEKLSSITIVSDVQTNDNYNGIFSAIGNVKITFPGKAITATSDQARYLKLENKIILTGNVKLIKKETHSITAQEIVFYVGEDRIEANSKSDSQVRTKFLLNSLSAEMNPD